jgi:tetratricopeptide (TPR) repeat protein
MDNKHPDPALLASFGRERLSRRRNRDVVRHLLAQCESCCRMIAARSLPLFRPRGGAEDAPRFTYDAAFAQAWQETERRQAALSAERSEAPELLRELMAQPADRQWKLATSGPRYHTWAFCVLVLEAARELGFQDPLRAVQLSRLGVEIADHLDAAFYGEARVNDLRARAWAGLGNAQRILADFRQAEEGFAKAERLLKKGTGDPLEKACLLLLKSSLRGNQQRFREAFRLLDRVVAIGRRHADGQLCGKALIMKGFLVGVANDPEAALRYLAAGIRKVDPISDPRLFMMAQHNLVLYLMEGGHHEEALRLLESARPLYHQVGDQMGLVRLRWIEGKIAIALGKFATAEEVLRDVRKELIERDLGFDAALLSLDLARIYAEQGRSAEMLRLAEEMIPMFESRDIHREATAALLVFHKAAEMERVTLGLIRNVRNYLQETRKARGLRSRDPR